jgi:hypothetical protein
VPRSNVLIRRRVWCVIRPGGISHQASSAFAVALPRAQAALCRLGVSLPQRSHQRSTRKGERTVKLWTSTLAAGAILAFAAPAGYAATSHLPSDSGSTSARGTGHGKVVVGGHVNRLAAKDAKIRALVARNNQLRVTIKFLVAENKQLSAKLRVALTQPVIVPAPTPTPIPTPTSAETPAGESAALSLVAGPNDSADETLYEDC